MFLRTTSPGSKTFTSKARTIDGRWPDRVWEDGALTGERVMSAGELWYSSIAGSKQPTGMRFYKAGISRAERPDVLINCVVPVDSPQNHVTGVVRGIAAPRPNSGLSLHLSQQGCRRSFPQSSMTAPSESARVYLFARVVRSELLAFNPGNLAWAAPDAPADDWDPAGVRSNVMNWPESAVSHRVDRRLAGDSHWWIRSRFRRRDGHAARAGPTITWSTTIHLISPRTTGANVIAERSAMNSQAEWVAVHATATNGIYVTIHVYVEPTH